MTSLKRGFSFLLVIYFPSDSLRSGYSFLRFHFPFPFLTLFSWSVSYVQIYRLSASHSDSIFRKFIVCPYSVNHFFCCFICYFFFCAFGRVSDASRHRYSSRETAATRMLTEFSVIGQFWYAGQCGERLVYAVPPPLLPFRHWLGSTCLPSTIMTPVYESCLMIGVIFFVFRFTAPDVPNIFLT